MAKLLASKIGVAKHTAWTGEMLVALVLMHAITLRTVIPFN
jgi:hypothetical protein